MKPGCTCGEIPTYDPTPLADGGKGWHLALPDPKSLFGHEQNCPAWRRTIAGDLHEPGQQ